MGRAVVLRKAPVLPRLGGERGTQARIAKRLRVIMMGKRRPKLSACEPFPCPVSRVSS